MGFALKPVDFLSKCFVFCEIPGTSKVNKVLDAHQHKDSRIIRKKWPRPFSFRLLAIFPNFSIFLSFFLSFLRSFFFPSSFFFLSSFFYLLCLFFFLLATSFFLLFARAKRVLSSYKGNFSKHARPARPGQQHNVVFASFEEAFFKKTRITFWARVLALNLSFFFRKWG